MNNFLKIILTLFIIVCFPGSYAKQSAIEEKISHIIDTEKSEQLSLLETLVNINSGTSNLDGIHQVGEILRHRLDSLGFITHWANMPVDIHSLPVATKRAAILIYRLTH